MDAAARGVAVASSLALWSVFISIIALPYILVGSVFDSERGIWYGP